MFICRCIQNYRIKPPAVRSHFHLKFTILSVSIGIYVCLISHILYYAVSTANFIVHDQASHESLYIYVYINGTCTTISLISINRISCTQHLWFFFSCMYLMRLIEFLKRKKFLTFSVFVNLIGLQYNKYILDDREKNSMSFCVSWYF